MAVTASALMGSAALSGGLSAAGSIAGGIMGNKAAKKQSAAAQAMFNAQMARLEGLQIPDIEKQKIVLKELSSQGVFTPEQEQAIQQQITEMESISVDPRLKAAQMNALQTLSQMGQTPFDATEKAEMNQMRREVAGQEEARQKSILQSLAQRGMLGSGQELAQRLSSSQGSADRASQQSDALTAMAQRRMLESVAQAGNMATNMNTQEFDQQAQTKRAQDVINQFNTQNSRDVQMRNIGAKNVAGADALANKQRIADENIATQNKQEMYNKGLLQQKFENEYRKATGAASAYGDQAGRLYDQVANKAQSTMNMYSGAGQALAGIFKPGAAPAASYGSSGGGQGNSLMSNSEISQLKPAGRMTPYGYSDK